MRKFIYLLAMTLAVMLSTTNGWGQDQTLTVADGKITNTNIPIDAWMADGSNVASQVIYKSDWLTNMQGFEIKEIQYYCHQAFNLSNDVFEIRIKTISETTFDGTNKIDMSDALLVYSGTFKMNEFIQFSNAFLYNGGNLIIEVKQISGNDYGGPYDYYGINTNNNVSLYRQSGSPWYNNTNGFTPKVTFKYGQSIACPSPKELTCNSTTATGASFTWQQGGSETSWQYIYGTKGFTPDWTNAQLATTQSVNLTGLSTGTAYDFYVRAYCSEDEQSEPAKVPFATPCDASQQCVITMTEVDGDGWSGGTAITITDNVTKEVVKTFTGTNDDNVSICKGREYEINASGNYFQLLCIGYKITDAEGNVISTYKDIQNYPLTFSVNCTNCFAPVINDSTIDANSATFSWTGVGNQWQYICVEEGGELNWTNAQLTTEQTATLTGLNPSTGYTFYVRAYCSEDEQSDYVTKQFETHASETCLPVKDVEIPQFTYNSATVIWTIGNEGAWKIQYKKDNEETWTNATIDDGHPIIPEWDEEETIHAYVITGLEENTKYYVRVKAVCGEGDESDYVKAPNTFTTPSACPKVTGVNALVQTWNSAQISWTRKGSETEWAVQFGKYTNDNLVWSDPETIDINNVVISEDTIINYLKTGFDENTTYKVKVGSICDLEPARVPEMVESKEFTTPEKCAFAKNLESVKDELRESSARIRWDGTNGNWEVKYSSDGETWKTPMNQVQGDNQSQYVDLDLVLLSPATTYTVKVKRNCGTDGYSDEKECQFTTLCGTQALPLNEDFDSWSEISSCWATGDYNHNNDQFTVVLDDNEGDKSVKLGSYYYYYTTTKYDSYITTPILGQSATGWKVDFDYKGSPMQVRLMNPDNKNKYEEIYTCTPTDINEFEKFSIEIPKSDIDDFMASYKTETYETYKDPVIQFYLPIDNNKYGELTGYINNVSVTAMPTCRSLKSLTVTEKTRTTVTAQWNKKDGVANCTGYEIVISSNEDPEEIGIETKNITDVNTTSCTFEGLTRNTEYYIHARANCGNGDHGEWKTITAKTDDLPADCSNTEEKTLTVDSYDIQYLPWGDWYKSYYTQQIYTAAELTNLGLHAGYIGKVAFQYALSNAYTKNVTIYIGTTADASFSSTAFFPVTQCSQPVSTTFNTQNKWYEFELSTPFYWDGTSNIVVGMMAMGTDYPSSGTATFKGGSTTGNMSAYSRTDSGTPSTTAANSITQNRANIKFTICPMAQACPAVTKLEVETDKEDITKATITWTASTGDYANTSEIYVSKNELTEEELSTLTGTTVEKPATGTTFSYTAENLDEYTDYYVYVRCNCYLDENHDDGNSAWEMVHFKSLASCLPLNGIAVSPTSRTEATVTCTLDETAIANLSYFLSETEIGDDEIITPTEEDIETSVFTIDGLTAGQKYYLYVANDCSVDGTKMSPYIHTSFTMPAAYPTVSDGSITGIGKYGFTVNWTNNDYLEGDTYEMLVTESDEQPESTTEATYTGITGTSHEVTSRNRDTHYIIYMRGCTECNWVYVAEATTLGLTTCEDAEAIAEGTVDNRYMPVMGDFCDSEQKVQMIYPSTMLSDIQGKTINAMKFFVKEGSSSYVGKDAGSWENIDFEVRMAMTERTELVNSWDETPSTLVYTGHLRANQTEGMTINFDNGFKYTGGNLLIETKVPKSHEGCWSTCVFYGKNISASDMARTWNSYYNTTSTNNSLPKVQFTVCETAEACPTVTVNGVEDLDYQSATITWTEGIGDFTTSYDLIVAEDDEMTQDALDEYTDKIENISETFQEVTGLSDDHDYYAYVRVNCNNGTYNDGYSKWSEPRYFHTAMLPCPQPTNIIAEQAEDAKTTAVISWTNPAEDPVHNYSYVLSTAEVDPTTAVDVTTTTTPTVTITNLTTDITYYFYVKNDCGDIDGESKWAETTFTLPSMPAVTDIQIDNITYNTFNISWTQSALGDETEWLVECTAEGDNNPTFSKVVNTNECYIFGLSSSTKYSVNVYPFESTTSTRGAVATKEEKTLSFNECYVVADSWEISENTPSTWYLPFTNYRYAYSQIIYDQNSLGGKSGKIVSIKLKRYTGYHDIADRKVFIGKTNKSSFESGNDWIAESDLTEIFSGTIQSGNDDFEIELATPFEYDGTGSIVLAFSRNNNSWETQSFYHTSTNAYSVLRRFDDNDPSFASHPEENSGVLGNERTNVEFCFETELTCGVPVLNLSHSNATENSVEVTWLPGGTERSWDVACLTEEMTEQSVFTIGTVTDIEWSTDTLSQGTHYYVYVRPACDKDADWEAKTEFTTCGTIGNYMICENNGIMEATLMKVEDSDLTAVDYDISYGTGEEEYLSYNYQFTIPYYIEGWNNNYFEVTAVDKHAFDELSSIDNIRIIAGDYVEFGEITAENIIYGTMREINKGENQYTVSQPYKVNANDPGIVIVTRPYPYTNPQQPLEITCENGTEETAVSEEDGTFHRPMGAKWDYGNVSFTSVEPITSNMLKVHLNEPTIINATRLFNARVAKDANAEVGDVDFTNCDSLTFQIDVINRAYPNYDFTSVRLDENTKVNVEMTLNNKEYYYFALPFGCDIDDIKVVAGDDEIERSYSVEEAEEEAEYEHRYVLLTWDESEYDGPKTSGYVALDGNATKLEANKGYAILIMESYDSWKTDNNVTVDATATFTANSNYNEMVSTSESVDITTTRKDFMNTFSGWNLVGNPYYSTIQGSWYSYNQYARKINYDRGGTDASVTDYKPDVPVFNVDIKPFETLFVQKDDGAGQKNMTVGNPTLQNAQQAPAMLPEYITITLNDNERMMDRTTIINNDMASDGYMQKEDLIKSHLNSNEIYTTYYDIDFSFNEMNIEEGKKIIPVGVKVANEGDYTIALSEELTNYGIGNVVLHDKTLNKFTTLSDGEEETLHLGKGRTDGRLELIITVNETITSGEDIDDNGKVEVFVNNGIATINGAETGAIVMITDATGKTIYTTEATGDRIDYEFAVRGVYMITVRGEKVSTMKVVY